MTDDVRRTDAPDAQPELAPYLDALGGLRPPEPVVPGSSGIDDPGEVPDGRAIDQPDPRLEQPGDTATGGDR